MRGLPSSCTLEFRKLDLVSRLLAAFLYSIGLVDELRAHQLVLIFLCAAIGTLIAFVFLTSVQALCFGLITGVFTYSFLLSRAERENNIKFSDFEQPVPQEPVAQSYRPVAEAEVADHEPPHRAVFVAEQTGFTETEHPGSFHLEHPGAAHSEQPNQLDLEHAATAHPEPDTGSVSDDAAGQVPVGEANYKRRLTNCWKCQDEMYVYTWDGHRPWQIEHPPEPMPESLQLRWSNTLNTRYWANTCLKCGSAQSDDALFDSKATSVWEDF